MDNINSMELEKALLALDQETSEKIILSVINKKSTIREASKLITDTLIRVGNSWENGHLSLSQVYMSGIICEKIVDKILPMKDLNRKTKIKIAIGVFEDFHMLGKKIVCSTLRASGIELIDLGGGLSIEKIVSEVQKENIKILLLSVLMLPSALRIKKLKKELANLDVKIVVGGAPFRFDKKLYLDVGADFYGDDSAGALEIVNKLIEDMS